MKKVKMIRTWFNLFFWNYLQSLHQFNFSFARCPLECESQSILKEICEMRTNSSSQNAGCAFFMGAGEREFDVGRCICGSPTPPHRNAANEMGLVAGGLLTRRERTGRRKRRGREGISATKKSTAKLTMDNRCCRSS